MKQIFLIETVPGKLSSVMQFIADINAQYKLFGSVVEALRVESIPDLIVLLGRTPPARFLNDIDALNKSIFTSRAPRIYIIAPESEEQLPKISSVTDYPLIILPAEKIEFLSTASGLMNIPFRRKFRIIVTIEIGSSMRHSALSIDFSESGMSFESTGQFEPGTALTVHFVNPKNRNRISIEGSIVRSFPARSDTTSCYGVHFKHMSATTKKDLLIFVKVL